MPELPIVNTNYRNLSNGDPGQALSFQRDGMANAANSVPNPNSLGSQVMDMLRQYQSGFQNTANQAQRQQAVRGASTPSNLIGADPSLQRFVRSSSQMALEPTIGGARAAISEAGEAIARLGQLRQEEEQTLLRAKAEKKQNIDLLLATGTAADVAQFLATSPETFKEAGYDPKAISSILPALKLREERETALFNKSMAPTGGSGSAEWWKDVDPITLDVLKQDSLDTQTIVSNYEQIRAISKRFGKEPDQLTEDDIKKLADADQITIGKALARMQNPDISRSGGDAGSAFTPTGKFEELTDPIRQAFTRQLYAPSKILEGIRTAQSIYQQRLGMAQQQLPQQGGPMIPGVPAANAAGGSAAFNPLGI